MSLDSNTSESTSLDDSKKAEREMDDAFIKTKEIIDSNSVMIDSMQTHLSDLLKDISKNKNEILESNADIMNDVSEEAAKNLFKFENGTYEERLQMMLDEGLEEDLARNFAETNEMKKNRLEGFEKD